MDEIIINNEIQLLELAHSLGKPISSRINGPLIDNLVPLNNLDAHSQSLSANYGTNDFPFHTDGAYFKTPPRFIILRYVKGIERPSPTFLCDLKNIRDLDKDKLKQIIWKVRSRSADFLSTILSDDNQIFRFDKCIMTPAIPNNDDSDFFEKMIEELPKVSVYWNTNKTIVLDNWKFLHARPKVTQQEINKRTIQRVMVL